jgi:5-methylcytosine-specific restriction endonuclease McrA
VCNSIAYNNRPARESLRKQLGRKLSAAIAERDSDACVYCGATEASSGAHLHLDHLTPRSAGGSNEPTNLVTACRSCNSARQDMPLAAWARKAHATLGLEFTAREIRAHARRITVAA